MENPTDDTSREQHRDVTRVEAFSDGVFAFAITLLVITIRIPRLDDPDASAGLQQLVTQQWPSYVAFAITFAVVGIIWANHRVMFSHIARTDRILVSLNLLGLMASRSCPYRPGFSAPGWRATATGSLR